MELLIFGLLVGLDNFAVASGLGAVGLGRDRQVRLAVGFFAFEALMPLVGLWIGQQARDSLTSWAEWVGPCALVVCALLVLAAIWYRRTARGLIDRPAVAILLPLALSFDNLTAGVSLGSMGLPVLPAAVAVGGISGALAVIGLAVGQSARSWSVRRAEWVGSGLLVTLAFVSILRMFA